MPINVLGAVLLEGPQVIPGWELIKTYAPAVAVVGAIKYYFGGSSNIWERDMHGRVFMITGGTSGVGAQVAFQLASQGAQIVLLVRKVEDQWLIDYIEDMRERTNNFLIYAEECDLASLHSVRKFATKWLDNSPPRRLDGVVCCAAESIPPYKPRQVTTDGLERQMGVNYVSHFHLLTLLGPALRVQPPDRDVRVVLASCASQSLGELDLEDPLWQTRRYPTNKPLSVYGTSKLLLGLFAKEFQNQLDEYERKDKAPCNVRLVTANPGILRTPSTRRFLSLGSVWGLILYWILFPIWFIFLKSAYEGSQSIMYALSAKDLAKMQGAQHIQECRIVKSSRKELFDEELQKQYFQATEKKIEEVERQSAKQRAMNAPPKEKKDKKEKTGKEDVATNLSTSSIQEDVYTMPKTPEELEAKLNILRKDLASAATKKRKGKKA
ncbi:hypothetical protein CAAN1_19S02894 [[Candida] anglica]|uniref:Oxidoreductase n=1 Tax=[Candida] anglica TaxID=148631 RepID=A0ABP0E837_9ASCO